MQEACAAPALFTVGAEEARAAPALFTVAAASDSDLAKFRALCTTDDDDYERRLALQLQRQMTGTAGHQRVHTNHAGIFSQQLECLRPARGSWANRHDPLHQPLIKGRVCASELCDTNNCALHVRDAVVLPDEAALLIAHGETVLYGDDRANEHRPRGKPTLHPPVQAVLC